MTGEVTAPNELILNKNRRSTSVLSQGARFNPYLPQVDLDSPRKTSFIHKMSEPQDEIVVLMKQPEP
jgi:hypothetical protein